MSIKKEWVILPYNPVKNSSVMKNKITSILALTTMFVLAVSPIFAAPPPSGVPIDGGISLVLAACAGYGAKKLHDNRKSK